MSGKTLEQRFESSLKRTQWMMTVMGKELLGRRGMLTGYPQPLTQLAVLQKSLHWVSHHLTRRLLPPMPVTQTLSSLAPSWIKELVPLHLSWHRNEELQCIIWPSSIPRRVPTLGTHSSGHSYFTSSLDTRSGLSGQYLMVTIFKIHCGHTNT